MTNLHLVKIKRTYAHYNEFKDERTNGLVGFRLPNSSTPQFIRNYFFVKKDDVPNINACNDRDDTYYLVPPELVVKKVQMIGM